VQGAGRGCAARGRRGLTARGAGRGMPRGARCAAARGADAAGSGGRAGVRGGAVGRAHGGGALARRARNRAFPRAACGGRGRRTRRGRPAPAGPAPLASSDAFVIPPSPLAASHLLLTRRRSSWSRPGATVGLLPFVLGATVSLMLFILGATVSLMSFVLGTGLWTGQPLRSVRPQTPGPPLTWRRAAGAGLLRSRLDGASRDGRARHGLPRLAALLGACRAAAAARPRRGGGVPAPEVWTSLPPPPPVLRTPARSLGLPHPSFRQRTAPAQPPRPAACADTKASATTCWKVRRARSRGGRCCTAGARCVPRCARTCLQTGAPRAPPARPPPRERVVRGHAQRHCLFIVQ
jgi:hypothetical protein